MLGVWREEGENAMIQWNKLLTLILLIAVIVSATALAVPLIIDEINLGLDLQGGVYVLLEAQPSEDSPDEETDEEESVSFLQRITGWFDNLFGRGGDQPGGGRIAEEDMVGTIAVLRNRVDQFGFAEPIIQREGERRIRVELAVDPNVDMDQQAILDMIGTTAQLEFLDADGNTVITGANLRNAQAGFDDRGNAIVSLRFDSEGAQLFEELTRTHIGQQVPIVLDGEIISNPVVNSVISGGQAQIEGIGTIDEAANLANLLRSGALPLELVQLQVRTVGPTLGLDSLQRSLQAGMIGLVLILVFMIVFYRLPGLMAAFSLLAYLVLLLGTLTAMGAVLTLPGILGIILTIGMAVDANVIIFERIKEELYNGKTFRTSVVSGFRKALSTILDSNVTTLIVAAILFQFGTGPIRGFALTLSIGVIVSMISALGINRLLMSNLIASNVVKARWLLGVNK
ncbi:MAG: protein translocase subunit SecD [Firmicutes bacterium]|nr:protein translocase subunit SecD [Bacillota bacterium]